MQGIIDITFMRHGRSVADDERVHEGRYDSPLTETGRQQVRKRVQEFKKNGIGFDLIISSSLSRAQETAKIVNNTLQSSLEIDAMWMERDNGPLAGIPFSESRAKFPLADFVNPYQPYVVSVEKGESEWSLYCRAVKALERVINKGKGRYLVIAHGGILNAAIRSIVNAPPPVNGQGIFFNFGDTGYMETTYDPLSHKWIIKKFKPK